MTPARKTLISLLLCLLPAAESIQANFDHSLLDTVLKAHVENGLVDYASLKTDKSLDGYLNLLNSADLSALTTREEKMAFWINAYNAYTLKLITDYFPVDSIMDIQAPGYDSPWKIPLAKVAGRAYSLDHIENNILRVEWSDARIHYALVCAARSCPLLRNEAYTANRLDEQLNEQGVWFMEHRNTFTLASRGANLSQVFEWYAVDFGNSSTDALLALVPFVEPAIAQSIKKNPKAWKITFAKWDWRLNVKK